MAQYTDSLALPRVAAVLMTLAIFRSRSPSAFSVSTLNRIIPFNPFRHLSTSAAAYAVGTLNDGWPALLISRSMCPIDAASATAALTNASSEMSPVNAR